MEGSAWLSEDETSEGEEGVHATVGWRVIETPGEDGVILYDAGYTPGYAPGGERAGAGGAERPVPPLAETLSSRPGSASGCGRPGSARPRTGGGLQSRPSSASVRGRMGVGSMTAGMTAAPPTDAAINDNGTVAGVARETLLLT